MAEKSVAGVSRRILSELNDLVGYTMAEGVLLDADVLKLMSDTTLKTNREVLIMTDDHNVIRSVSMGDAHTVSYNDDALRTNSLGLNRIRVIHTHPGGDPRLSGEDLSSAKFYRLQCMIAIGVKRRDEGQGARDELCDSESMALCAETRFGVALPFVEGEELVYHSTIIRGLKKLNRLDVAGYAAVTNKELRALPDTIFDLADDEERALLLGVNTGTKNGITIEASMEELRQLVKTAGGTVIEKIIQNREHKDATFYFGKGKLSEIARLAQNADANLIVTNDELNANQIANIEAATGCKTIDRTTVILDIFARHAKTKEGKLQVELAQQKYRLSHLKGMGIVLSRTGGGIGTRGPGEKKLELDRRHIRRQMDELLSRIEQIDKNNALAAKQRKRNHIRTVALVGYTNSGKSTLFNRLTDSNVVSQDALFVTLDSTMRQIRPEYGNYLLSDTVGFIEKLPHDLITAFKTTLKEVEDADLLLHVVDASDSHASAQKEVVYEVLAGLNCGTKPMITVYNKIDKLEAQDLQVFQNRAEREDAVCISAKQDMHIDALVEKILAVLEGERKILVYHIPYSDSKAIPALHDVADPIETEYTPTGTKITVEVGKDFPGHKFEHYLL